MFKKILVANRGAGRRPGGVLTFARSACERAPDCACARSARKAMSREGQNV